MLKKINGYFEKRKEYNEAKKAVTLMVMNQYYDFLVAETDAKNAEKNAYESMTAFGDNFKVDDLEKLISGIDKIANNPKLQTEYFKQINKDNKKEKDNDLKVVK